MKKLALILISISLSSCVTLKTVGISDSSGETVTGSVSSNLVVGGGYFNITTERGVTCSGAASKPQVIPNVFSCNGQEGTGEASCADGRTLHLHWIATSCNSGYGDAKFNDGSTASFVFTNNESELNSAAIFLKKKYQATKKILENQYSRSYIPEVTSGGYDASSSDVSKLNSNENKVVSTFESDSPSNEARKLVTDAWTLMSPNTPKKKRNYKQSYEMNLQAFEHHHPEGASNIGLLYEKGWGVARDIDSAEVWYLKAISYSQYHSAQAELGLARIYLSKPHDKDNLEKAADYIDQAKVTAIATNSLWAKDKAIYIHEADILKAQLKIKNVAPPAVPAEINTVVSPKRGTHN